MLGACYTLAVEEGTPGGSSQACGTGWASSTGATGTALVPHRLLSDAPNLG